MALTGRTDIGFHTTPSTYALNVPQPENAAETFTSGAVLQMVTGELTAPSGDITSGYGIAYTVGGNLAADGDDTTGVFRFEQGKMYEGTFSGTLAEANLPGGASNIVKVTQTAGVPLFIADAGGKWRVIRATPGWAVGDTNPRIQAIPFDSFIQAGGGNE
jgi:hypothetical protein